MEKEKFDFSQFSTFEENGKTRNINELEDYLKEKNKDISVKETLKIGDEVKLKGVEYTVIVTHINFEIPGNGRVDYAGKRQDEQDDGLLRLFNQKDIESKIVKREKEER